MRAEGGNGGGTENTRIERDVPMKWVVMGSILIVVMMWILLTFHPMQGAETSWYQNLFAGVFVVVFGFLFVTVAGRISGLLGNSSNPISGMSIATLMATCAIFFLAGWTAPNYAVLALMIGGVVCIAAAIAGATSQDLKTGFLVGATPFWQQMGLLVGVTISTVAIGATLNLMNKGLERYIPTQIPVTLQTLPSGVKVERDQFVYQGKNYVLMNVLGSHEIPDGEYLYDSGTSRIEYQWAQGIGSDKAPAPQARLMATVISGILNQRLPWRLVLMGVALVVAVEILGVRSLAFATGMYISIATTAAMFAGGLVRWAVEASMKEKSGAESEASPGALYSSGLIAAGEFLDCWGSLLICCRTRKFRIACRSGFRRCCDCRGGRICLRLGRRFWEGWRRITCLGRLCLWCWRGRCFILRGRSWIEGKRAGEEKKERHSGEWRSGRSGRRRKSPRAKPARWGTQ